MAEVFGDYWGVRLDDYEPQSESQRLAKDRVADYVGKLKLHRGAGHGLFLSGDVGVGKTMLASVVLNSARDEDYRTESILVPSYIDLLFKEMRLAALMQRGDSEAADRWWKLDDRLARIKGTHSHRADWVLFDDLGSEYSTEKGWAENQFSVLIRLRCSFPLPFLITTNLNLGAVMERYGERLLSVLLEKTEIIEIPGSDYRAIGTPWSVGS